MERAFRAPADEVASALLAAAEDQWFDRKSARIAARELANGLIAMANADGGVIVVGLSDGDVEGTDRSEKRRNEQLQANLDFCIPPVRVERHLIPCRRTHGAEDHLLVFDIDPSDALHMNVRDEVYLRVGDANRRLAFRQREELLYEPSIRNASSRRPSCACSGTAGESEAPGNASS